MSLVIPGSGQIYVGGSTFNYVRGGVYLALEAGLWGSWYYYSVYKYNKQVKRYKKYAKEHYSAYNYESKMQNLYTNVYDDEKAEFTERYLSSRESYCKSIYGTASTNKCYTDDAAIASDDRNNLAYLNGSFDLYDESSYYSLVAGSTYVLGWDDVEDETAISAMNLSDDDAETVSLGSSANLLAYRSLRSKANDYADMQAWFFGGLILNHLLSAVDAAWSAHAHNKVLYEEDVSWYDQLHINGYFIPAKSQTSVNVYLNF